MSQVQFSLRNRFLLLGDVLLIGVSVFGSFALRLEFGPLFNFFLPQAIMMFVLAVAIKPIVYHMVGLYRRLWVFASMAELKLVVVGVSLASILVGIGVAAVTTLQVALGDFSGFPRSVILIDLLLSLFMVGGLRFAVRLVYESRPAARQGRSQRARRRVLIVGAGSAGDLVVRELQKNPQLGLEPICFLDDDPAKIRHQVHGVPVDGALADLPTVILNRQINEVIIAIPSAPGSTVRKVTDACRAAGVSFRTMPGIYELLGGNVNVSRLREVDITDLLRREPTQVDTALVGLALSGRAVLVTGAGGSIGRELCRQIARWGPAKLILLGHGENSIFETMKEMEANFPTLPIFPVIADVRDSNRLYSIFERHRPEVVFHAAAHKHVPLMEVNVEEAVTNNVLGTRNIVDMGVSFNVQRLVMISSDKAVKPTSVMGATKRVAEMLVIDAARRSGLAFSVVRFGNVLGSRGSIVPFFKQQIASGGPLTVTHPDMQRYFMTIPEAVYLVLQASSMGKGGEVFVLNMGMPVRILDLAEDLVRLSGLEPYVDIDIVFTGIRPGEKLSEELWDESSDCQPTNHPDVLRLAGEEKLNRQALVEAVGELIYLAREGDSATILQYLDQLIPGAQVSTTPPDARAPWN